jgi:geranylgeranyl diphosphate synthase type II
MISNQAIILKQQTVDSYLNSTALEGLPKNLLGPIKYLMDMPCDRSFSIFIIAAAEAFGASIDQALSPAAAMEIFNNFILVHDDIMNDAEYRSGQQTVNSKFGRDKAILTGDAMYPHAIKLLRNNNRFNELLKVFVEMSMKVMEGNQLNRNIKSQDAVAINEQVEMIKLKVSTLYGCCCAMGAIIGGAQQSDIDALYEFRFNLGSAYHINEVYLGAASNKSAIEIVEEFQQKAHEALAQTTLPEPNKSELKELSVLIVEKSYK